MQAEFKKKFPRALKTSILTRFSIFSRTSFWKVIKWLPPFLRAKIVRARIEIDDNLSNNLILKQAETEDEISQALALAHDSYVELGYMQPDQSGLRFTKYLALPTTVILVAKINTEVIATLSIISDSALGLPSEPISDLNSLRQNGKLIAEISSLTIKKNFRFRRGKLFLPLCKIMYLYCTEILRLDGIVASTNSDVEPFYTDLLLFEVIKTKIRHPSAKNKKSSLQYLAFNEQLKQRYKQIYNKNEKSTNLYHFFYESTINQIQLPKNKKSIQAILNKKNEAMSSLIQKNKTFHQYFDHHELRILQNLDPFKDLEFAKIDLLEKNRIRYEVRSTAVLFLTWYTKPLIGQLVNISANGFQIKLEEHSNFFLKDQKISLAFQFNNSFVSCDALIKWNSHNNRLGCQITNNILLWKNMQKNIELENTDDFESNSSYRKTAN